jgi:hypothetical protein
MAAAGLNAARVGLIALSQLFVALARQRLRFAQGSLECSQTTRPGHVPSQVLLHLKQYLGMSGFSTGSQLMLALSTRAGARRPTRLALSIAP